MVRADRNEPKVYFGRPGALLELPWPKGDLDKSYDRLTYDFLTGSGQHMVSTMPGGSRPYALTWNALHVDTYSKMEQYWTGMMGKGPWAFIDPSARNLLMSNQASTTHVFNDTREWKTSTGLTNEGTLSSNTNIAKVHRPGALRNLRWLFTTTAATTPILGMGVAYRNWWGIPTKPGLSYAWSVWLSPDGIVDASITLAARIQWLDATGAVLSEATSGSTVVTTWTRLSAVGVAPVGAVYMKPIISATGATITTGGSVYVDEPMLEQDTVINDWAPGTGIRPVEMLSFNDSVPFAARFRKGLNLVLRELAP